ncbi:MAG: N-formylglutamate amidohydrolase [Bdellovibrionales bacterium]
MKPLLVTIPHSGEKIPVEVTWLKGLSETHVMCDVDRFVDRLYLGTLQRLGIPHVVTDWHRYVVDLNRLPEDIDADAVEGSRNPPGTFTSGLHWVKTTTGLPLISKPMSMQMHNQLVERYFSPFHSQVESQYANLRKQGYATVYHMDLHSMPSRGTSAHRDPGQIRAEIVISDFNGKSCSAEFKDLVTAAYKNADFQVAYNWPYIGGRVTQQYGQPHQGQHAIQVELRRDLYMDEDSKQLKPDIEGLKERLGAALAHIHHHLK